MRNIRVRQFVKVRRTRNRFQKDMQALRLKLLGDLQQVFDMAKDFAKSKDPEMNDKRRQGWVSIMAYTGQVMNSITKSFDETQITKDLERLERLINEAMATEKNRKPNLAS